jgi:hypothetical protein
MSKIGNLSTSRMNVLIPRVFITIGVTSLGTTRGQQLPGKNVVSVYRRP